MLTIRAKCDHCGKKKDFSSSSVTPEYPAIRNLLKKLGWIVTLCCHFCSYKCQEDYRLQCEHETSHVIKKSFYSECSDCGEIWEGK